MTITNFATWSTSDTSLNHSDRSVTSVLRQALMTDIDGIDYYCLVEMRIFWDYKRAFFGN